MKNSFGNNLEQANKEEIIIAKLLKSGLRKKNISVYSSGNSMEPFFKDNSLLQLEYPSSVGIGNVVCYLRGENIICHRVVKIKGKYIITKADNDLHFDEPIRKSQILGKIATWEKNTTSTNRINYVIAKYSLLQAKIYEVLIGNPFAEAYCKVMKKHLKIPYLTLIYKELTKLFIYPLNLFISKNTVIKRDIKKETRDVFNDKKVMNYCKEEARRGLSVFDKKFIEKYFNKKGKVLVLGCGIGREAIYMSKRGNKVIGVDFAENMLKNARLNAKKENLEINFLKTDITSLPLQANNFDFVTIFYTLNYLKKHDRLQTLKECHRVLKKNGLIIIIFWQPISYISSEGRLFRFLVNSKRLVLKNILREKYTGLEPSDNFNIISINGTRYSKKILTNWFEAKDIIKEARENGFKLLNHDVDKNFVTHIVIKKIGV